MEVSSLPRGRALVVPRSRRLLATLSDERLVEQVRRGSEAAFEVIYDRHHRGVLAFCRHMLASREEAEDAVQHSFAQAYSSMAASDRELHLKAWLYTIARNRCLSILRARREPAQELGDVPTAGLSEAVQQRSDLHELLCDMRELPDEQRAALVLSELGDLSHSDIAAVLECEAVKVKSLVFQARASLIESRSARETPCVEIREQLATLRGGALRRGALRRHVKACPGCAAFSEEVSHQRRLLAAVIPVVPTIGLKHSALAVLGGGGGAGGVAAGGGGAAGGGVLAGLGTGGAKLTASVVATVAAVGGGAVISHNTHHHVASSAATHGVQSRSSQGTTATMNSHAESGPADSAPSGRPRHGEAHQGLRHAGPHSPARAAPKRSRVVGAPRSHPVTNRSDATRPAHPKPPPPAARQTQPGPAPAAPASPPPAGVSTEHSTNSERGRQHRGFGESHGPKRVDETNAGAGRVPSTAKPGRPSEN